MARKINPKFVLAATLPFALPQVAYAWGEGKEATALARETFIKECNASGSRVKEMNDISKGDPVRIDSVVLCINSGTNRSALFYRASANEKFAFPSRDTSPAMTLTLMDARKKIIYQDRNFDDVIVGPCGGYQPHSQVIPGLFNVDDIYWVDVDTRGGSKKIGCQKYGPWDLRKFQINFEKIREDIKELGETAKEAKDAIKKLQ